MTAPFRLRNRTQASAVQMGHNGGPKLDAYDIRRELGPFQPLPLRAVDCGAKWTGGAFDAELLQFAKNQRRIELRQREIDELRAENRRIAQRGLRRVRRAEGKDK